MIYPANEQNVIDIYNIQCTNYLDCNFWESCDFIRIVVSYGLLFVAIKDGNVKFRHIMEDIRRYVTVYHMNNKVVFIFVSCNSVSLFYNNWLNTILIKTVMPPAGAAFFVFREFFG